MNRSALMAALVIAAASIGCDRNSSADAETQPIPEPARAEAAAEETGRGFRMEGDSIVADTFDIRHELQDGRLAVALHTDLGDATKVMVRIARIYHEEGREVSNPVAYVDEASTVGAWRQPRTIDLADEAWTAKLEERQRAATGTASDSVEIDFVVPVNQDPPFEWANANLGGSVVVQNGDIRVVQRTVTVHAPVREQPGNP